MIILNNKVIIAAPDDDLVLTETANSVRGVQCCATLTSKEEIIPATKYYQPQVCLFSPDLPGEMDVLDIAEILVKSNVRIVFLAGDLTTENPTVERLQRMGVTDILYGRPTAGLLIERLTSRGEPFSKRETTTVLQPEKRFLTDQEPEATGIKQMASTFGRNLRRSLNRKSQQQYMSDVMAVWSPAPTGKSFVAMNLAVAVSFLGKDVALVDISPDCAIWALSGAPDGEDGLQKAIESPDMAMEISYKPDMIPGLYILTIDPNNESIPVFTSNQVRNLTEKMLAGGLTVVYDLGQEIRGLKDFAETIILVCDHDYNHLLKIQKAIIKEENWLDRVIPIINRHVKSDHLPTKTIKDATGMNVNHIIPEATVPALESQRVGVPVSLVDQNLMQNFMALASNIDVDNSKQVRLCR